MEEILQEFENFTRGKVYTHRYELFAMLFDRQSTLYDDGFSFLDRLVEIPK